MNIKHISPAYAVSAQIDPGDMPGIKAAGFGTIICNRPDAENPPSHAAAAMQTAAEAEGLVFILNPVTHQGLNMDMVTLQRNAINDATAPTLAYCASGTRSTVVWALGQAGTMDTDAILTAAAAQGYDIGGMRSQLDALS